MIIMFWNKEYNVKEVGGKILNEPVNEEKLNNVLEQNFSTTIQECSNSEQWAAFGILIGQHYFNLNIIYTNSLAAMLSGFASGLPQSYGTEVYLKEENIENLIIDMYKDINSKIIPEEEKFIQLMEQIIKLYANGNIQAYEKAAYRITTYITYTENELFEQIPGLNNHEKMQNLLNSYHEYNITEEW